MGAGEFFLTFDQPYPNVTAFPGEGDSRGTRGGLAGDSRGTRGLYGGLGPRTHCFSLNFGGTRVRPLTLFIILNILCSLPWGPSGPGKLLCGPCGPGKYSVVPVAKGEYGLVFLELKKGPVGMRFVFLVSLKF